MKRYDDYTNEMLCAAVQTGEKEAREALIRRNLSFVRKMANASMARYRAKDFATSTFVDDMIQAGCEALITAAESYDPDRGSPFLAFARVVIRNQLCHAYMNERSRSPIHILDTKKARTVIFLDDSYDGKSDSFLAESIPDFNAITPEEYTERIEKQRELWNALGALDPRSREFLMLRYQLGKEKQGTPKNDGILTLKESAKLAHISISRAKRMESEALAFLKEHIEEQREYQPAPPVALCPEVQSAGEKLLHMLRQKAAHSRMHVGNIPFIACLADHPETISGIADLTVIMAEQRKSSSCVPKWVVSTKAGHGLRVCMDFPDAEAHLHLHIDDVSASCRKTETAEDAPDISEWLWFLASELWQDKEETEYDTLEKLHVKRRFIRDICGAILEWLQKSPCEPHLHGEIAPP